jgi:hypothetical protein
MSNGDFRKYFEQVDAILKAGTGQKVVSKFNYKDSVFSESGFLNYVIRYGGGGGEEDLSSGARQRQDNNASSEPREFFPLRNFVLAQADRSPDAEKFKKKIINFTGDTFSRGERFNGITAEDIAEIAKIEQAIKCPPDMTALASVSLHKPGDPKPFCNNIQAFKPHAGNVIMTVESIDLEVTTDPKVGAGTVSVFQGTMNIRFKTADKDKKTTDILNVIANNEALNYIFALENEYEIHLKNLPKPAVRADNKGTKELKNYDALTNPQLGMKFLTNTIKYELIGWKPHVNEAIFSITFAQSTTKRKVSTAPIPVKANATKEQLRLAAEARRTRRAVDANNLTEKIIRQIRENNSLFKYEFVKNSKEDITSYLIEVDRANKTTEQINARNGARNGTITKKVTTDVGRQTSRTIETTETVGYRATGGFFLFRSLIIAALQSFVPTLKSINLTDKDIENLLFFIDETEVPTEVGTNFNLKSATDVRCTLETVVVDFNVFTKFMDDLYASSADITLDYFFQRVFSSLLLKAITASRNRYYGEDAVKRVYTTFPTIGGNEKFTTFDIQEKNVRDSIADGYKCFTITILKDVIDCALKDPKLSSLKNVYVKRSQRRTPIDSPLPTNIINKAGSLEIKTLNEKIVRKAVDNRAGAPQDKLTFAIFIDKIGGSTPSLGKQEIIVSNKMTPKQLREQGIIALQPFRQKDEIFSNRIVTEGVQTPFKFTKIDNKDLETERRLNAGAKALIRNIYSVSFSLKSVLGIRPYKNRFLFYPSFFYGGTGKGKSNQDAFGFAGVYTCNSVSISLSAGANSFVTSISAYFENEIFDEAGAAERVESLKKNVKFAKPKAQEARTELEKAREDKRAAKKNIKLYSQIITRLTPKELKAREASEATFGGTFVFGEITDDEKVMLDNARLALPRAESALGAINRRIARLEAE